jgi:hypothetical protein
MNITGSSLTIAVVMSSGASVHLVDVRVSNEYSSENPWLYGDQTRESGQASTYRLC